MHPFDFMKAIIPVAGVGTRLRPLTYTQPKALIPVAGKPIIDFIIDQLVDAGIHDIVFIVGYFGDKIESYVKNKYKDLTTHFVIQSAREGIGDAIWRTKDIINNNEEILIILGDTIIDFDLKSVIKSPHSTLGVKKVDDPRSFGVVELGENKEIISVVEKPKIPKSNLALVGVYKIKESIDLFEELDYIITNNIRTRDEFQLTDGIMRMIEKGIVFDTFDVGNWYDCGKRDVLLETNATLLKKVGFASKDLPNFENSIMVHPVSIGENCKISNCIIGPDVTIGDSTTIDSSIIRNSIIGSFTSIQDALLYDSVIGGDANINGTSQSLNIGDNTEIDFR